MKTKTVEVAGLPSTTCDFLVVGSGIAGLFTALKASKFGQVILITKRKVEDSNTDRAQGGIAAAIGDEDSPLFHLEDTLQAGAGLCEFEAAWTLVNEAPARIDDLIAMGTRFDRNGDDLALTREAAHGMNRILHAGGDATGEELRRAIAERVKAWGIQVREDLFVLDLLVTEGTCVGALVQSDEGLQCFLSPATIICTGGAGQIYQYTTNPEVATGDGVSMAYRAGAEVMDLEFFQFHPTALYLPGVVPFLISEAVRGEGGTLRNAAGERFMVNAHPQAELAPRDIVARAIQAEMERTESSCVYLDVW